MDVTVGGGEAVMMNEAPVGRRARRQAMIGARRQVMTAVDGEVSWPADASIYGW